MMGALELEEFIRRRRGLIAGLRMIRERILAKWKSTEGIDDKIKRAEKALFEAEVRSVALGE